ncbi:hypothetical protein DNU06_08185 [Putridiphycobacter roseus]|uniref:10-bladed beta-propeller domain-containing protein n=1 Tax=Putridiphycobacter roseus TaxID=2219161 RepID=A0A2W1NNM3_9FLAO|nr:hypothetical protein [Putridiphycobacter roseus]PZE17242.1 hypothetical protein DNU06_08185 [Putridiphycobacter roseus]
MKKIHLLFVMICLSQQVASWAQAVNAVTVQPNKLYYFNKGNCNIIEFQQISNLLMGFHYVTYTDRRGDVMVCYEGEKTRLTQGETNIIMTNNHLVYQLASVLRVFDRGESTILSSFVSGFAVGDSIVMFQDKIGGNLKYYYRGNIVEFSQVVGDYMFDPGAIGDNLFAFRETGGNYKAFYQNQYYNLTATNQDITFSAGMNMIAFNDYANYSFAVFDHGEVLDLENQYAKQYKAGHDFVYYQDNSGVNKVYYNNEIQELGYELQEIAVYDSLIFFKEADYAKVWYQGEVFTIYNDIVKNYQVSGGSIAYMNSSNGVNALIRGVKTEITRQKVQSFTLNGNTVSLVFTPSSFAVWWNGKRFNY